MSTMALSSRALRQAILLGMIGALLMGFTIVNTLSNTNLNPGGGGGIKLTKQVFSDDPDVVVIPKRITRSTGIASPVGDTAPGVEASSALPQVNNNITRNKYIYEFEVKEAAVNSWQSGENFKVEVWMDNGTNTLIATLYTKQMDLVDDTSIEGLTVVASTEDGNNLGDVFNIVITRQ